jgi:hypothetical protein
VLYFLDPVAKSLLQAADLGESFEPLLANTLQHLYPSIDPRNLPLQTLRPMARSVQSVLDSLIALELVMEADRQYSLTPKGRDLFQSTQREEAEFRERIWPPLSTRPQCRPGSCVLPIGATDDNASEEPGGKPCHFSIGTDNIYLGECQVGEFITAGFRFRGVDIPARTRVHHAFLQFVSDGPYSNNLNLAIHAEASADSQSFSPSSRPSDRPLTTTYMPWRVPRFEAWSLGQIHSSPDVSAVIQEVLDRPDWTQGNALAIIIRSIAGGDEAAHRRLVGFRRAQANSILQPPRLVIDFAPPDAFA